MDTFKLYVFALTCIALIFVQLRVDAALGSVCSDSTECDTGNSETCNGTTCVCDGGFYESGTSCAATPVKVYGDGCTAGSSDECPTELFCVSPFNKCLCANGSYYTEPTCTSTNVLKPYGLQHVKTHNSVTLSWTSPDADVYTNSYVINYNGQSLNVNGQDVSTLIPSLSPGTTYNFIVARSIIREGRTQAVPASEPHQVTTYGIYSDSCTAVTDSTECRTGLSCVSGTLGNKCLCQEGSYLSGSTCTPTNALIPVSLTSPSQTVSSVTLTWTSPDALDYTNSHVINYSTQEGSSSGTHNVNNQDLVTTVNNLSQGTTYVFTVVRSITRNGRSQAVPATNPIQAATKRDYGSACTGDQCRIILSCITGKCLCAQGKYFTTDSCNSIDGLQPFISDVQPTSTSSVNITWSSPTATEYSNSYVIKYTKLGTSTDIMTSPVTGSISTLIVSGLKAGTSYTFKVVRSITREGRTQTVIDSAGYLGTSEKINYGQPCVSNGTCKGTETDCYSLTCRCKPGNFRTDTACLPNFDLRPSVVNIEKLSTTQLKVTWTPSAYPGMVTDYLVVLSPSVPSENIVVNGTSATISSLTPGERYGITVRSISSYLNRGETAAAGTVYETIKPTATKGRSPSTSLMEPTAQIYFYKAVGRAHTYTVTLTGNGYNGFQIASGPEDVLSVNFTGVSAGLYYNLTIITISHGVSSDPFSERIRVSAEVSEAVVELTVSNPTSRAAKVSWKRPIKTKGALYKYTIEVFNSSTCVQRINIQCTECLQSLNISESTETSCEGPNTTITKTDLNDVNFLVHYDLSLLPDTHYTMVVAAYNEEGKGQTDQDTVYTEQEAPGDPTEFRNVSTTSESVELRWTPPKPRPGVTTYIITVNESDGANQYMHFKDDSTLGFYNVSINITGLSSYWKYRFEMYARTIRGDSNTTNVIDVTTEESAPTAVENLEHQPVDGVFNRYQLSWRCPPQKGGRNGVIRRATVNTSSFTQSVDMNPKIGKYEFNNIGCTWSEQIIVTPEFNYTFEVYISNSIKGESTTIQRYMPAGPASLSRESVPASQITSSTELKTIPFSLCPSCILDPKNGRVTSSGIIVCKESCNSNRRKRQTKTQADYENFTTWTQSKKIGFNDPYRATNAGWLASHKDSGSIKYIIGNDTKCAEKQEKTFCNGPLEEGTKYIVIVFACTSAGCGETDEVSISTAETSSKLGAIIGAVVGVLAAVFVVIIVVIVVRRRRAQPTTSKWKLDEHSDEEELILKKRPIQIKNFEKRTEEMHRDSNLLFSEEFEDINALSPKEKCIASETNGNKLKNRYVNILPFDATRVKLRQTEEDEEGSDYINANYIPGYRSPREYIATQGPMTGTITDFWRMIWEQNVPIIIMLSDLQEKGKPKVDRYYPENMEPVQYGDIVLEMTNFSTLNKYVIRIFKLQVGEEVRMVRHYFLPGWQDFGANLNSDDVIDFVKNVRREIKPNNTGPMCVHCSAGVGRTGTYIALDVFQQHIDEEKLDKEIDIFDFVLKMRYNRSYMVQTEKQYIFIHDTIKEMVIKKKKELAERDNIYMNNENTGGDDIYVNQAFETDPQDIYMNVDNSSGKPTTVL